MTSPQLSRLDPNELQSRGVTPFIVTHLRALLTYVILRTLQTLIATLAEIMSCIIITRGCLIWWVAPDNQLGRSDSWAPRATVSCAQLSLDF